MGGIVKSVKKAVKGVGKTARKIIPNEVADVAVKAAPFVAPFNPLLAGGMAALGSYDQTGSFGKALKSGLFTYGGGQLARGIGGAGFQRGFNPFAGADFSGGIMSGIRSLGTSPIGTQTGLKLGQYEMFGGPGREEFLKSQEIGKAIQTDAARTARLQDLDTFDSIEAFKTAQADPKLAQIKLDADKVIENIYGQDQKTGYGNLFKKVVEPSATLGERTAAIKELGGKALKDIYTTKDGSIDKLAVGATIAGAASYMEAKKLAEEAELVEEADDYTEEMYEADRARYDDYYKKILPYEAFGIRAQEAEGGLLSLRKMKQDGSVPEEFISYTDDDSGVIYRDPEGNPITKAEAMRAFSEMPEEDQILMDMEGKPLGESEVRKRILPMPKPKEFVFKRRLDTLMKAKDILQPESFEYLLRELKEEMTESGIPSIKLEKKANGGRVGFSEGTSKKGSSEMGMMDPKKIKQAEQMIGMGMDFSTISSITGLSESIIEQLTKPQKKAKGGIINTREGYAMGSEVPIRQNEAGTKELDYRQSGGFVPPIGIKEKADDIPAMLSNNEFVFTADAVRAAGGGSVNKGAQKMYALMKQLEGKVV